MILDVIKGSTNTKAKRKKYSVFALYLNFSEMAYIAFCHETIGFEFFHYFGFIVLRPFILLRPQSFSVGILSRHYF